MFTILLLRVTAWLVTVQRISRILVPTRWFCWKKNLVFVCSVTRARQQVWPTRIRRLRKVALVAIALIVCSLLTWNQTQYWQPDKTVHQQALKVSPDSAFLHNELGKIYKKDGKIGRALEYYRLAAQLDPRNAAVQYNLGKILEQAGMINQALQHYASFLAQDPPAYRATAETLRRRLKAPYGLTLAENPQ